MSRVGNKSIPLPAKVTIENKDGTVSVSGPKGKLSYVLPLGISFSQDGTELSVKRASDDRKLRALHGTSQRLISNMIIGVNDGFVRQLEIHGTGFRAGRRVRGRQAVAQVAQVHLEFGPVGSVLPTQVQHR